MKIIVCSKNPVKILAAEEAFKSHFNKIEMKSLDFSQKLGMLTQPLSAEETLKSAIKRVEIAQQIDDADYYCSMEGGMGQDEYGAFLTWYVCVAERKGEITIAGGGRMPLPKSIYKELKENKEIELGDIMDRISDVENTKQKGGSTALFTENRIIRKDVFKQSLLMALIPYTSKLYKNLQKL